MISDGQPRVWNRADPMRPRDAVYVGRPTKWGNPFSIGRDNNGDYHSRDQVIELYRKWLLAHPERVFVARHELRGKHLVCWCAPRPCHADILLQIANE